MGGFYFSLVVRGATWLLFASLCLLALKLRAFQISELIPTFDVLASGLDMSKYLGGCDAGSSVFERGSCTHSKLSVFAWVLILATAVRHGWILNFGSSHGNEAGYSASFTYRFGTCL